MRGYILSWRGYTTWIKKYLEGWSSHTSSSCYDRTRVYMKIVTCSPICLWFGVVTRSKIHVMCMWGNYWTRVGGCGPGETVREELLHQSDDESLSKNLHKTGASFLWWGWVIIVPQNRSFFFVLRLSNNSLWTKLSFCFGGLITLFGQNFRLVLGGLSRCFNCLSRCFNCSIPRARFASYHHTRETLKRDSLCTLLSPETSLSHTRTS